MNIKNFNKETEHLMLDPESVLKVGKERKYSFFPLEPKKEIDIF